jgi:hypothetical protein
MSAKRNCNDSVKTNMKRRHLSHFDRLELIDRLSERFSLTGVRDRDF